MRRQASSSRSIRYGLAALIVFATPRLASAVCSMGGPDFGQILPNCGGGYCYVVSPGDHTAQSLAGSFWSFGSGQPAAGQGNDNGTMPVGGWLVPWGSNLYIGGNWRSSPAIDGCIDGAIEPGKPAEIMVALISDESYSSFFAVAAARRVAGDPPAFDFTFVAGGGVAHDIDLVELPRARVVNVSSYDVFELASPTLAQLSPGIYSDGSVTAAELVTGYRVYKQTTWAGSFRTTAGWTAVTGIVPLGQNVVVTVPWPSGQLSLATTLVFDGGFETAHVGPPAHALALCHPTDADGDGAPDLFGDPECCPDPAGCDCNDNNASVHPGALELCNGIDDNCDGLIDNVALPGAVASLVLGKDPVTTRLSWPTLPVATGYDIVRGDLTTLRDAGGSFSAATKTCLANDLAASNSADAEDPDPGFGFWYLLRAANCTGVGSYDSGDALQLAPRDAGIAASGHACP
jgi:hypothetical protein